MPPEPLRHALLYVAQDTLESELHSLAGGAAAVCSMRCPSKESTNEDAAALIPAGDAAAVLVVADGVGGERAGSQASEIAVRCLEDAVSQSGEDEAACAPPFSTASSARTAPSRSSALEPRRLSRPWSSATVGRGPTTWATR